jgi:hypothetical protein
MYNYYRDEKTLKTFTLREIRNGKERIFLGDERQSHSRICL